MMRRPGHIAAGFVLLYTVTCGVQVEAVCNTDSTVFDCNSYNPLLCQPDLHPFCLTNGTQISGSCEAKRAVCLEHASLDETNVACNPTATTADCHDKWLQLKEHKGPLVHPTATVTDEPFDNLLPLNGFAPSQGNLLDCVCYDQTGLCRQDLHVFCLDNGTTIFGSCSALKAVCHERAQIDETGLLCPGQATQNACDSYTTSGHCTHDLLPFCLTNGTKIFGTCEALKAVCHEHATLIRCEGSAATSFLISRFLIGPLIAACVTAWGIIK